MNYLNQIKSFIKNFEVYFDLKKILFDKQELEKLTLDINFWNNPKNAQKILKEITVFENEIKFWDEIDKKYADIEFYNELCNEEKKYDQDYELLLNQFKVLLEKVELNKLLNEPDDHRSALLTIHPGAGGTESQDWAQMLLRLYKRWSEKSNFTIKLLDIIDGDIAGIKDVTLEIHGRFAYGNLKAEAGVHRLVRISPFDSGARRHTSFASVWVYPAVEDDIKINIDEKDLRIDTYRSSGAGGQHVNTTDSAVRITHLPTKIVVQCQNERSQHKNKETCHKMLRARLYEHELQKREEENKEDMSLKTDIGWGHQIRSYVLQPYQLVKDLRNKVENTNPEEVLNGNIDEFIEAGIISR